MRAVSVAATATPHAYGGPLITVHRTRPGLPRVVVAHDHAFVGALLQDALADGVDVVGDTLFGQAASALCELFVPDVVVAAEVLGDGLVDAFLPEILRGGSRVLVVTDPLDPGRAVDLVGKGVTGLVDADQSPNDLLAAVVTLAAGGAWLSPAVTAAIVGEWRLLRRGRSVGGRVAELTDRELEVLGAMTDGLSTKAAARRLGITAKTVENHKTRIFDKLGVRTQAQAIAVAASGALGSDPRPRPKDPR